MQRSFWSALLMCVSAGCGTATLPMALVPYESPQNTTSNGNGPSTTTSVTSQSGGALFPASIVCQGNVTWHDEFSGTVLNSNDWNYEVNCDGGGNNEDECYVQSPNNVYLDAQGHLVVRVLKANAGQGKSYTSGRLNTSGHQGIVNGCVEARLQVPTGQGFWPAFWLLSQNSPYGAWPESGELDIMEILGGTPTKLYGTAHFGAQQQAGTTFTGPDFSAEYHVFSLQKSATAITWYVDGQAYFTLYANQSEPWGMATWPFTTGNPFYVILNVAMGGNFAGTPDPALESGAMQVDYVRLYGTP